MRIWTQLPINRFNWVFWRLFNPLPINFERTESISRSLRTKSIGQGRLVAKHLYANIDRKYLEKMVLFFL